MDGRAGLLVQRGLPADPVVDLPVQGAAVIQKGLGGKALAMRAFPGDAIPASHHHTAWTTWSAHSQLLTEPKWRWGL